MSAVEQQRPFTARAAITISGWFNPDLALDDVEEELWSQLSESGAAFDHGGLDSVTVSVDSVTVTKTTN